VDVGAEGSVSLGASVTYTRDIEVGLRYTDNSMGHVLNSQSHSTKWGPVIQMSAAAHAAVRLIPTLVLSAPYVAAVNLSFAPYLAASVAAEITLGANNTHPSCSGSLGWGVDIDAGGTVELKNPVTGNAFTCSVCEKTFGPYKLYHGGPWPIFNCSSCNQCLGLHHETSTTPTVQLPLTESARSRLSCFVPDSSLRDGGQGCVRAPRRGCQRRCLL